MMLTLNGHLHPNNHYSTKIRLRNLPVILTERIAAMRLELITEETSTGANSQLFFDMRLEIWMKIRV